MITRDQIVAEAVSWVGTPFHANQKLKHVGADCIGVVAGVAENVGLHVNYRNDYSLRPDGSLLKELREQLIKVDDGPLPGDVILMAFEAEPHHVALYIGNNEIVHSYAQARKCVRQQYSRYWHDCSRGVYRFPGVED